MLQEGTIGDTLILFLQCAIFTVLKVRELYAPASFERQRLLEHDVWWNTCVEVEDYVVKLATSLRSAINRDRLSRLLIDVLENGQVAERFAIDFPRDPQLLMAKPLDEVVSAFRSSLVKLEMSASVLPPARPGARWRALAVTRPAAEFLRPEALVPRWQLSAPSLPQRPHHFLPLGAVRGSGAAGIVVVEVHVEDMRVTGGLEADIVVSSQAGGATSVCRRPGLQKTRRPSEDDACKNEFEVSCTDLALPRSLEDRQQLLRRALLSKKIYGAWRRAPGDLLLRLNFAAKGLISSQEAPAEEVYAAMRHYAGRLCLPSWRSYNGYVASIQDNVNRKGWQWAELTEKKGPCHACVALVGVLDSRHFVTLGRLFG
ncbi:REV7 [Symbiodinium sp. CCMP2592]|nr:REV7 [Symbiodinium sp. CCMP2592]